MSSFWWTCTTELYHLSNWEVLPLTNKHHTPCPRITLWACVGTQGNVLGQATVLSSFFLSFLVGISTLSTLIHDCVATGDDFLNWMARLLSIAGQPAANTKVVEVQHWMLDGGGNRTYSILWHIVKATFPNFGEFCHSFALSPTLALTG